MSAPPVVTTGVAGLRRAAAGVRWWAREMSGEAAWDRYVDRCRAEGREPLDRRSWERHRDQHREQGAAQRCC